MITEDYCSYEVSKLLKEKGFDEPCFSYYKNDKSVHWFEYRMRNSQTLERYTMRPHYGLAMKWLREKHKIYADPMQQGNYDDNSIYYSYSVAQIIDGRSYIQRPMSVADKFTYKEAVEAALNYSLENLI